MCAVGVSVREIYGYCVFAFALFLAACGGGGGGGGGGGSAPVSSLALFAGDMGGSGSVDGTGAAARFRFPTSVATDSAGNVYVADSSNDLWGALNSFSDRIVRSSQPIARTRSSRMSRTVPRPPSRARLHGTSEFRHTGNSPPTRRSPSACTCRSEM
jgi:hypothetical protein